MFTGLVEEKGVLATRTRVAHGARLFVKCRFSPLVLGESISTDGVCLTVESIEPGGFWATASSETLEKSTLGDKAIGVEVNLERALPLGGRLGGHIVSGHVDGVGRVESVSPSGPATRVSFTYPAEIAPFVAEKGSIAVNGVSLTINGVTGHTFHVMLVPHTQQSTAWVLAAGERVNLEVDVLARYVARILAVGGVGNSGGGTEPSKESSTDEAWLSRLAGAGYL